MLAASRGSNLRTKTSSEKVSQSFILSDQTKKILFGGFFAILFFVLLGWVFLTYGAAGGDSGTSESLGRPNANVLGISTSTGVFTFNVPTVFKSLLTAAVLKVEGDSAIGGDLKVDGATTLSTLLVNGKSSTQR